MFPLLMIGILLISFMMLLDAIERIRKSSKEFEKAGKSSKTSKYSNDSSSGAFFCAFLLVLSA